jgi:hypothetical protein
MLYALAAAWRFTGGAEWAMRLLFVPANLAAVAGLYLLAGLFLSEPLWPALILAASPAWLIDMNLLYPETLALGLVLPGLYLLASGGGFWLSALLCGLAVFTKYGFVFAVPTGAYFLWRKNASPARIVSWCAAALAPILGYLAWDALTYHAAVGSVWTALSQKKALPTSGWAHTARSVLAFTGGGAPVLAVWPFLARRIGRKTAAAAAACALLFLPALDVAPLVRGVDRLTGCALALGAVAACSAVFRKASSKLWLVWTASALAVQVFCYWSVIARVILMLLPPLVIGLAEELEARFKPARLSALYKASFAGTLALSAALALVDQRYAAAQRDAAESSARHAPAGLWCAGHWGLQFYMERAGARELDAARGGWDEVRPGDVVVVPWNNSNVLRPSRGIKARVATAEVPEAIPLRLLSARSGEAGFYSNATGFLPFSLSREPLDRFDIVEILPP